MKRMLLTLFALYIVLIFWAALLAVIFEHENEIEEFTIKKDIYSAELTTSTNGVFVLGTGNVKEEDYYAVYVSEKNYSYSFEKYKADKTTIFMDIEDGEHPYLLKKTKIIVTWYELHLPKGTIQKQFNVNVGN